MMKKHLRVALVSIAVALGLGALMAAKPGKKPGGHLRVTEVFVDFGAKTIEITGEDFDFGPGPLTVSLGEFGDISDLCMVDFTPPQLISCDLSAGGLPPGGDYLLTVTRGGGQSQSDQYDLTIGAGPLLDTLPSGRTLRGIYTDLFTAAAVNDATEAGVSFPLALASAPTAHFIPVSGAPPAGCIGGTAAAPTADPGHLCVYEVSRLNVRGIIIGNPLTGGGGQFSRFGFYVTFDASGPGFTNSRGSWAVTAA